MLYIQKKKHFYLQNKLSFVYAFAQFENNLRTKNYD